ncbi:MAG: hypothetical protein EON58_06225, partial [Alphaproteobacteria bacterium]
AGRPVRDARPCIVAHAHYPEFVEELLDRLGNLKLDYRLVITTTPEANDEVRRRLNLRDAQAEVWVNENRGRDVLPFLKACDRLLNEGAGIVLKVHGKKSPHLRDGQRWRAEMLDELMTPERVASALEAFAVHSNLGMVGPAGHWLSSTDHMGGNADGIERLTRRLDLQDNILGQSGFFAGTMFWVRLEAIGTLLDAALEETEFESESGAIDGTTAHACERLLASIVIASGFRIALSDDPASSVPPAPSVRYRYLPNAPH